MFTVWPSSAVEAGGTVGLMSERTKYPHGVFSWADLTTADQDAAKQFYTELFGWKADDRPVGDGVVYSMMEVDGKDVAAISPQRQQQRDAGVPPTWNSYVTVESADEALTRAKELGANVHADAFDVMDVGRMGVVQDPQGAYFIVWEPKTNIGAQLVNVPGAFTWNELASPDIDASKAFYGDLFGWTTEALEGAPFPYLVIKTPDGRSNGGIRSQMRTGASVLARVLRGRRHRGGGREGRGAGRLEARGTDVDRARPDRDRPGPAGRRVRAVLRRVRRLAIAELVRRPA